MKKFQCLLASLAVVLMVSCQSSPAEKSPVASVPTPIAAPPAEPNVVIVDIDSTGLMRFGGKDFKALNDFQSALIDSLKVLKSQGKAMPQLGYHAHGDVEGSLRISLREVFAAALAAVK